MKRVVLVLMLIIWGSGYAQDPEIIGTWYLRAFTVDLGDPIMITPEDAPQNPTLIIYPDYSFEGIGACNTFTGQFEYDPVEEVYVHTIFTPTTDDCGDPSYNVFEDDYFSYFNDLQGLFLRYVNLGTARFALEIDSPGFGIEFQDTPILGVEENPLELVSVYPTVTSDYLNISKPSSLEIEQVVVYNSQGQSVLIIADDFQSVDVSSLSSGIYFLQIDSSDGGVTKKFIKT